MIEDHFGNSVVRDRIVGLTQTRGAGEGVIQVLHRVIAL